MSTVDRVGLEPPVMETGAVPTIGPSVSTSVQQTASFQAKNQDAGNFRAVSEMLSLASTW
jgi:hypothetical protein